MTDGPERVSLGELFVAFLTVSLLGFGGGIAWARRIAVERRRWISEDEFTDILALCQFMPGPNIVGIAVCVGARMRNSPGALAALAGFILIPWAVGFSLGVFYLRHAHFGISQDILRGVSAAAAGLLIATGVRMAMSQIRRPEAVGIATLTGAGMTFTTLPLLAILLGAAAVSATTTAIRHASAR